MRSPTTQESKAEQPLPSHWKLAYYTPWQSERCATNSNSEDAYVSHIGAATDKLLTTDGPVWTDQPSSSTDSFET